jgi:hypothetical protein
MFSDIIMKKLKKFCEYYLISVIIIILGIVLRLKLLFFNDSFWLDTCKMASNLYEPYSGLFKPLQYFVVSPPFFSCISKLFLNIFWHNNIIETKEFILRIFPFLCSVLSLPLFLVLTEKMFHNKYLNSVCLFWLSFNFFSVYYSQEFKQYSCELLFTIILTLIFWSINLKNISWKKLLCYSGIISLSIWFSFTAIFIIAAGFLSVFIEILKTREVNIKKLILFIIPIIFSIVLFYFIYFIPAYRNDTYGYMINFWNNIVPGFIPFSDFIVMFPEKLKDFVYTGVNINILVFLGINILILFKNKNCKTITCILFPVILSVIVSLLGIYPFHRRLIMYLLPILIILGSQMILLLKRDKITTAIFIIIFIYLGIGIYKKPLSDWTYWYDYKYNCRQLYKKLCLYNPELKNVISADMVYRHYSNNKKSLVEEDMEVPFEYSNIPQFIEETSPDEYWIFVPSYYPEYSEKLKEYLNNNSKIKIINMYYNNPDDNTFIAQIEKLQ